MSETDHFLTALDRSLFLAINHNLKSPVLDFLMPRISDLGLGHVQFLALLVVVAFRGRSAFSSAVGSLGVRVRGMFRSQRRWFVPMVMAFAISGLGSTIIKQTVQRDRPFWYYTNNAEGRALNVNVRTVAERPPMRVRGFVSGHTATSVALAATATVLFWSRRRRALLAGLWFLVGVICFSRIYLADHWPIDVIGGAGLGLLASAVALKLAGIRTRNQVERQTSDQDDTALNARCAAGGGS